MEKEAIQREGVVGLSVHAKLPTIYTYGQYGARYPWIALDGSGRALKFEVVAVDRWVSASL